MKHLVRIAAGALIAVSAAGAYAQASSPAGTWETIDDATGKPKAIIQIVDDGSGQLSGKVVRGIGEFDHRTGAAPRAPTTGRINW